LIDRAAGVFQLMSRVDALTENPAAEKFRAMRDLCIGVQNECDLRNTCFADPGA